MTTKSILRDGYMAAALAKLKRDAGKLWVSPLWLYSTTDSRIVIIFVSECSMFNIVVRRYSITKLNDKPYTPARFRAALRRIKQKGGGK